MSRNRQTTKALIPALAVLVAGLIAPSYAAAKEVPAGHLPKLIVDGKAETFPVAIANDGLIFLYFSRPVIDVEKTKHFLHRYIPDDQVVVLTPKKRSKRAHEKRPIVTGTMAFKTKDYTAHLKLTTATELDWLEPAYAIRHRTEEEALQLRIEKEVQRRMAIVEDIARDSFEDEANKRFTEKIARSQNIFPVADSVRRSGDELAISLSSASWTGRKFYLALDVSNKTGQPVPLDHHQVKDRQGAQHESRLMAMFPEIEPDGGKRFLAPGKETRMVLEIPGAIEGDFAATRVALLTSATGSEIAWAAVDAWQGNPLFLPKPHDQIERERRDREALGRVTLQLQPLFGAMWLANPLEDSPLGMASVNGFSVRAAYGFNRFLSVEGELSGAFSGPARFSGMAYNNMQGVLTRDAQFGRAQIGGLLKLGHRYVPTLRLGIGLQGTDHRAEFTPEGGQSVDGPELGFQAKAYFTFGAGFDVRFGNGWLAGLDATFAQLIADESSVLLIGLHVGYSWQPGAHPAD